MHKKIMELNVLGTKYKVILSDPKSDERLSKFDGYCVPERKEIILDSNNSKVHQNHVITHELVHAFLYESGLDVETWANNEEIVDWIALQLNKMMSTSDEAIKKLKENNKNGRNSNENLQNPHRRC